MQKCKMSPLIIEQSSLICLAGRVLISLSKASSTCGGALPHRLTNGRLFSFDVLENVHSLKGKLQLNPKNIAISCSQSTLDNGVVGGAHAMYDLIAGRHPVRVPEQVTPHPHLLPLPLPDVSFVAALPLPSSLRASRLKIHTPPLLLTRERQDADYCRLARISLCC